MSKTPLIMLVLLTALMIVYHVGRIIYLAVGLEPLPTFEFLYTYTFLCGMVWFLKSESGRSSAAAAYCPGVTIVAVWFLLFPYHLLKSRGVRGLIPLFAMVGTYLALQALAAIVYAMSISSLQQ